MDTKDVIVNEFMDYNSDNKSAHVKSDADLLQDIVAFHKKFVSDLIPNEPRELDKELSDFRIKFMQEELDEYVKAVKENNLPEQFDALIDLVYVALGTALIQGFPFAHGWNEVQAANMSKVLAKTADDSKRGYKQDVVKPEGWVAPNIEQILSDYSKYLEYVKQYQNVQEK